MESSSPLSRSKHRLRIPQPPSLLNRCFVFLSIMGGVYVFYLNHTVLQGSYMHHRAPGPQDISRHKRSLSVNDSFYMQATPPSGDTCYLRDKLRSLWMPDLHSVFSDPVSGQVVFVGLKLLRHSWHGDEFRCEFPDGQVRRSHILRDGRSSGYFPQYVVVLTCPLPEQYRWRTRFQMNLRRVTTNTSYTNVTVCTSGVSPEKQYKLAICTMVKNADSFIPEWLSFHKYVGVEHAFIYDNEHHENSNLTRTLAAYIKDGFVTIIPWAHSVSPYKTYLEVQIAHENDCIWRHKHDVDWMIKIDVDEYIQPMDVNRTHFITDYLNESMFDHVGAVRVQNWFFGRPLNIAPRGESVIERNRWRSKVPTLQNTGHDKNILRPINVHYFKIHNVKLGADVISADPHTELRLVHYRTDNQRARRFSLPKFSVRDESMVELRNAALSNARNVSAAADIAIETYTHGNNYASNANY
ncbi:uncharacterized protein LOC110984963 [Acanthaster planci]|uniref:Glycosyltransferase family 92 protein n=1 Tax=Acanthaster planci TaxID=133434 RepID=A0A8B7Z6Q5_ACAPL|nr:uncharacterized protein LOC110984963 [Acanthaster planci]